MSASSERAQKTCAANAGVPAKPTFMEAARRSADVAQCAPGRLDRGFRGGERGGRSSAREALLLAQPRGEPRALQRRQVVDEDLALEVFHLVLDAHGEHAVGVELERLALSHPARARATVRRAASPRS